jgi:4-hydroxy-tetrahydrodipicolinate synthase
MQIKAIPLIDALFSEVNPIPVKKAMNYMGWCNDVYRSPLCTMDETKAEALKEEMKAYGLL